MSETTPDPADVHTGPDRVELTICIPGQCCQGYCVDDTLHDLTKDQADRVRDVVAARVQALTAQRDRLRVDTNINADEVERQRRLLDLARAELAAANARTRELEREIDERDKAHEGIVATITAAARADTRTAKSDAAKVQMLAERVDALTLSRDKHRNRAAALEARCAELEEEVMAHQVSDGYTKGYEHGTLTTAKFKAESDALQATLDRVTALAESRDHDRLLSGTTMAYEIRTAIAGPPTHPRAALTPEGTE